MSEQTPISSGSQRQPPRPSGADLRALPNDTDAERSVLGAMLLDKETISYIQGLLKPEDFFEERHQTIYRHVLDLHGANKPPDLLLLCDALKSRGELDSVGGYPYVAQLTDCIAGSSAAPEHARVVAEKATRRRMMAAGESILRDAADGSLELQDLIEAAESRIYEVGHQVQSSRFRSPDSLMDETLEEAIRLREHKGATRTVLTHMVDLDELIGGFERNALVILAARPSIGKTAFALNVVRNVALKGKMPVGFFSMEMGADQLNLRLVCTEAGISSFRVRHGRMDEQEWERFRATATSLLKAPIFIDDSASLTLMQLRSRARRLKSQRPDLALIVVDYLQLMRPPERRTPRRDTNRQQEVAEISMGLKALAKELECPVLALSQLSRSIEQRSTKREPARPQLSDLRESGAIEQDADLVLFIHRERTEAKKSEEGGEAARDLPIPTEIIVGKNRNGRIGHVRMLFFPHLTRFGDPLREDR